MKFAVACKKFFGKKSSDQTLQEFSEEIRALTPEDRKELAELLSKELETEVEF